MMDLFAISRFECVLVFFFNVEKHWPNTLKIEQIWFLREIKDFVLFFLDLIFNTV